jgi:hypothetical protein
VALTLKRFLRGQVDRNQALLMQVTQIHCPTGDAGESAVHKGNGHINEQCKRTCVVEEVVDIDESVTWRCGFSGRLKRRSGTAFGRYNHSCGALGALGIRQGL